MNQKQTTTTNEV